MQIIGFTGSRSGMTSKQKDALEACLAFAFLPGAEFHHGGCIGADVKAAAIAKEIGYFIVEWPGYNWERKTPAWARYKGNDRVMSINPYMLRNQYIVDAVSELYATPKEATEQLRSGTWSTIRKGRKKGIYIHVIGPNGETL
jgi:hypothetical protein